MHSCSLTLHINSNKQPINMNKASVNQSRSIFTKTEHDKMFRASKHFQPFQMFYDINREICKRTIFHDIDTEVLYLALLSKYKVNTSDVISTKQYSFKKSIFFHHTFLIPISKSLWVFYGPYDNDPGGISILYSSNTKQEELTELENEIMSHRNKSTSSGKIYLIHKFDHGFDLKSYEVSEACCNIKSHYNDDFEEFDSKIVKRLNTENDKGLVLLHGKPGTGKTSYIRHLTKNINKRMIFLSPEVSQYISSPEFITILSEYPNSIIIIEDAENVIKTRKSGGSSAISNLLNLTDGLLADCLKIQLICSFNTDVSAIDKALLRKGRLIAMYEFNELKENKAKELALSLGKPNPIKSDTILADIFNQEEVCFKEDVSPKIGFNLNSN